MILQNQSKEFLLREKANLEAYMYKIGPGEEYDECFQQWKAINEELEKMSIGHKIEKAFPWLTLIVTAVGSIGVPLALGKLAYRNSEEEGKLKNGDVWREAVSNTVKPTVPDAQSLEKKREKRKENKK